MKKTRTSDVDMPVGKLKRVEDFLPPQDIIMNPTYKDLCARIKKELKHTTLQSQKLLQHQAVLRNWHVGRFVEQFARDSGATRQAKAKIIDDLAQDLHLQKRFVYDTCKFYRLYLKPPKDKNVSWTHYQHLITIDDVSRRGYWERRISRENIGSKVFAELLYKEKVGARMHVEVGRDKLKFTRGEPYLYRVMKVNFANARQPEMVIDCGFHVDVTQYMNKQLALQGGFLVRSVKGEDGYQIKRARNDNREKIYTYKAGLKRVVDGDTLDAHIDLGFGIRLSYRLRLRGVDTPELGTPRGAHAKEFVESRIKGCAFLVIKSYGLDMYGRYVVDVFCDADSEDVLQVAAQGRYLNQDLLDAGLANLWR